MTIERQVARIVVSFPITAVKAKLRELAEQQHAEIVAFPGDYEIVISGEKLIMTFERDDG